jgi:fructose-1,6-bisphosphatase/inositol monophosphatase family enzyme
MNHNVVKEMLIEAGRAVRMKLLAALQESSSGQLSSVHSESREDTIYVIDRHAEDVLIPVLKKYAERVGGIVLMAEGIGGEGGLVLPEGMKEEDAAIRVIMDPIDGTRNIMYDKRAAFYLAGAAPNKGNTTRLSDIEMSVMVELPTTKQYLADVLWAFRGKGSVAQTENLLTGTITPRPLRPSQAKSIIGGFAQFARFFPPGREILSAMEDAIIHTLVPSNPGGKAIVFEDQYICSGGQLYELLTGHDRFIADVRGLLYAMLRKQGIESGHVCHPYDVCAHLIGTEAGLIITDGYGKPLDAPFDLNAEINWIGYANTAIEEEMKPLVMDMLKKYQIIP